MINRELYHDINCDLRYNFYIAFQRYGNFYAIRTSKNTSRSAEPGSPQKVDCTNAGCHELLQDVFPTVSKMHDFPVPYHHFPTRNNSPLFLVQF